MSRLRSAAFAGVILALESIANAQYSPPAGYAPAGQGAATPVAAQQTVNWQSYAAAPQQVAAPVNYSYSQPAGYAAAQPTYVASAQMGGCATPGGCAGAPAVMDGGYAPTPAANYAGPVSGHCGVGYGAGYANDGYAPGSYAGGCSGYGYAPAPGYGGPGLLAGGGTTFWTASAGALLFTREDQDAYQFSYDSSNEARQLVSTRDADMGFSPGIGASIGRFDMCSRAGWQLDYWQLLPQEQTTHVLGSMISPGLLNGIRNYDQLDYSGGGAGDGATAADNVNSADIHQLSRKWEIYSFEANRMWMLGGVGGYGCGAGGCNSAMFGGYGAGACGGGGCGGCSPCGGCGCGGSPWTFMPLAGFRFFKFRESLLFASDYNDTMITGDPDEYRIDVRTDNQLYGFQLGGVAQRALGQRLGFRFLTKAGLYGNHATLDYFEGGAAGAATINNGPNAGQMLRVHSTQNDLAFLGELGVGLNYRVGCAWLVGADYRVVGVSGVALPTDQIYFDTRGINDVRMINNDGSLLLHGAYIYAGRCF